MSLTPEDKLVQGQMAVQICQNQLRQTGFPALAELERISAETGMTLNDVRAFYTSLLPQHLAEVMGYETVTVNMCGKKNSGH